MISAFKVENNKFERTSLISINYIILTCTFGSTKRARARQILRPCQPPDSAENFRTNQSRLRKNNRRADSLTQSSAALKLPNSSGN